MSWASLWIGWAVLSIVGLVASALIGIATDTYGARLYAQGAMVLFALMCVICSVMTLLEIMGVFA